MASNSRNKFLIASCLVVATFIASSRHAASDVALNSDRQSSSTQTPQSATASDMTDWQALANKGDPRAQREVGLMYLTGRGVKQSSADALNWFRKAADQGNAKAQCDIGFLYSSGTGVKWDLAEALKWYLKA